jgi:hypothetical protein
MSVIPNAVDAARFAPASSLTAKPWHDRLFTLSIGELKERKGHHVYLAAFCALARRFPDWHHFVVGKRTGDAYERALLDTISAADCTDRVHLLGNVSEEEKIDLLQRAELFAHTPVRAADGGFEGFGIVYLEAAASGTATLGTLGSGAEDAVRNGVDGLLVPARAEDVQAAQERRGGPRPVRCGPQELRGSRAHASAFGDARVNALVGSLARGGASHRSMGGAPRCLFGPFGLNWTPSGQAASTPCTSSF